ncbi:energy transducer TonB [Novosphingobium resinovorum]|uniref:energy transducer TonB n=1 Tax=Novosphingobium resinovorum TaxID=158500 RepID=UPI002ED26867|nr:energy transducer TonB [Novosphingobium resinovorum]
MKEDRRLHHRPGASGGEPLAAGPAGYAPRYGDRPTDWRARLFGLGGTASVAALVLACAFFTWHAIAPAVTPDEALVAVLQPLAAPDEPSEDIPDGPRQVEQEQRKPDSRKPVPEPAPLITPQPAALTVEVEPRAESARPVAPVPQTTAPRTLPAPPAPRMANNAAQSWEARLLAHLEKYRRYPPAARARRDEGTVFVRFRMDRAGKVLAADLVRSSGAALLDRAALDTIRRAQPLPAIPDERPAPLELTVPVEFYIG